MNYDKLIDKIEDAKGMIDDVERIIHKEENVVNPIAGAMIECDEAIAYIKELRDK